MEKIKLKKLKDFEIFKQLFRSSQLISLYNVDKSKCKVILIYSCLVISEFSGEYIKIRKTNKKKKEI